MRIPRPKLWHLVILVAVVALAIVAGGWQRRSADFSGLARVYASRHADFVDVARDARAQLDRQRASAGLSRAALAQLRGPDGPGDAQRADVAADELEGMECQEELAAAGLERSEAIRDRYAVLARVYARLSWRPWEAEPPKPPVPEVRPESPRVHAWLKRQIALGRAKVR